MTTPAAGIEALLLVSARPVSLATLARATALPEPEIRSALAELADRYSPESSGIVLREVAGGYLLSTNPACAEVVERFREEARPAPLSGAALEVLSCVLYLGPLTRREISATRGVNSDAVVRTLIDRNLLAEVGPDRKSPGSSALLDVTEDFLISTGAKDRGDFPPLDSLVEPEEFARVRDRLKQTGGGTP